MTDPGGTPGAQDGLAPKPESPCTDRQVADQLRRHSRDALADAYQHHGAVVIGYAEVLLGSRAAAEDVGKDVFVALWRHPAGFDPDAGPLRSHLLELTYRLAKPKPGRERSAMADPGPHHRGPEDRPLPACLRGLAPDEGRVLELAAYGRHSYREVALLLGQPEPMVTASIRAGLRQLNATEISGSGTQMTGGSSMSYVKVVRR